ncbi:hypothetical protein D9758_014692 [Tetrapyrgos nigripes]|uniref:Peroxidase n=1 Tax=Tetrapyrgos nigripes TaxID=182062 RepID=A0A8H5CKV2_9AGAR|nr:hypothetical protein D9758_014692 [Tetrapyrgos nigripes]
MKSWLVSAIATVPLLTKAADLTWPSPYDEFEDIMYLQTGYARRGIVDGVNPCSFNSGGNSNLQGSASWIRTLFHDMITADISAGTGGLDASLLYEMDRPENKGTAAFNVTYGFLSSLFSRKISMADLTALGTYTVLGVCGGPLVQVRAGRIDATEAGPSGVPGPTHSTETMKERFATAGFNVTEMIASVACGHTLGVVHGNDFPEIAGPGRQNETDLLPFDSTKAQFDNALVVEYIHGNTSNPLVVGPEATNSDKRVFLADSNITMNYLQDPKAFSSMCGHVFERMMDTVPSSVKLSDPITPYPIKPNNPKIGLTPSGNITFTGSIRVLLKDKNSAGLENWVVSMPYADRNRTACDGCTIQTRPATFQGGFGGNSVESFKERRSFTIAFFEFNASIPASTSISKFNVTLKTSASSDPETYDNNGSGGFPLQDQVIFLEPQSCITGDDFQGDTSKRNMTIVAAVRDERADKPVRFEVIIKQQRQGFIVDELIKQTVQMEQWTGLGVAKPVGFTLFKATYGVPLGGLLSTFDVISGEGDDEVVDEFRKTGDIGSKQCF